MQVKITNKEGPKGLSIFHRLLISYLVIGIIIAVITGVEHYLNEQKAIKEELKSQFLNALNSAIAYFDTTYTSRIKEDLNFIEKSSAFNSFLSSQKDEILLTKSLAERLFLHFTNRTHGVYLSTRFIDSKGIERVITSGNKRLRDYVSLDNFPPTDILHLKISTLFKRLKSEKLGTILFEEPFEYGGKLTFLIGTSKNEPEVGGFAGVVIFHCDLTDYFKHLDGYVFHKEHVASVFILDGEQIFVPESNNPPVYRHTNLPQKERPLSFYSVSDTVRIGPNTQALFKVVLSISPDIFYAELRSAFKNLILYMFVTTVLVVILALVMSKQFSTPLTSLVVSANRLAKGDLSTRVKVNANGEIGLLVDSFNNMVEDLQKTTTSIDDLNKEITERKRAEEALRTSELRNRTLLENLPQKIFLKDRNSVYISCNDNYAQDLKIKPDEIIGKTDFEFYPKELAEKYKQDDKRIMESGKTEDIEEKYIRDGEDKFVHTVKMPVKDSQGNVVGILGVFWDITERKKIEESSRLAQLGKLVSSMAHEVNNPLMIISGNAQLSLMEEIQSEAVKNNLKIIIDESQKAKGIIQRLLRFSRPSKGETKEVDINKSIEAVVGIVEHQFKLANVEIKRNYLETPPLISIDEQQMQEVFMNLINNAVEAMPDGGVITITTSLERDFLRLDFQDTGSGMSEEVKKKVPEPFFTTKEKGTGLGLSVCYGIIKAHNGEMKFESDLNKGATVTVLLPLKERGVERSV